MNDFQKVAFFNDKIIDISNHFTLKTTSEKFQTKLNRTQSPHSFEFNPRCKHRRISPQPAACLRTSPMPN